MSKRHNDALAIWAGACNPSGIAHSIVDACKEIRAEQELGQYQRGTAAICADPALKLMVYQLAYITGVITGAETMARSPSTEECARVCKLLDHPTPESTQAEYANAIRSQIESIETGGNTGTSETAVHALTRLYAELDEVTGGKR